VVQYIPRLKIKCLRSRRCSKWWDSCTQDAICPTIWNSLPHSICFCESL